MSEIIADEVTTSIIIGGYEYELINLETDFSRYNEVDRVDAKIIDPLFENEPSQDEVLDLELNGTQMFQGFVNQVKFNKDGSFRIQGLNDLFHVKNEEVYLSITEDPTPISTVVAEVCEQAGVDYNVNLTWYTEQTLTNEEGDDIATDYNIGIEETGTKAAKVLDKLARWADADWWFNNYNVLQFGLPDSQLHKVEHVFGATASDMLPPYKGVKVTGGQSASKHGYLYRHVLSEEPAVAFRGIFYNEDTGSWETRVGEVNNPVFTLKDKQIKTHQQAEFAAKKLANELFKQVKGGKVKIVGTQINNTAEIDALDVIEMPNEMGQERYFVGRVNHKVDSSNGYTVVVECEGLVPGRYGVEPLTVENP